MLPSNLCYSTDAIYDTICRRIRTSGYIVKQKDDERKELMVTRWSFPFTYRKFNIKVVRLNEDVSNISVRELGMAHLHTTRALRLGYVLEAFF